MAAVSPATALLVGGGNRGPIVAALTVAAHLAAPAFAATVGRIDGSAGAGLGGRTVVAIDPLRWISSMLDAEGPEHRPSTNVEERPLASAASMDSGSAATSSAAGQTSFPCRLRPGRFVRWETHAVPGAVEVFAPGGVVVSIVDQRGGRVFVEGEGAILARKVVDGRWFAFAESRGAADAAVLVHPRDRDARARSEDSPGAAAVPIWLEGIDDLRYEDLEAFDRVIAPAEGGTNLAPNPRGIDALAGIDRERLPPTDPTALRAGAIVAVEGVPHPVVVATLALFALVAMSLSGVPATLARYGWRVGLSLGCVAVAAAWAAGAPGSANANLTRTAVVVAAAGEPRFAVDEAWSLRSRGNAYVELRSDPRFDLPRPLAVHSETPVVLEYPVGGSPAARAWLRAGESVVWSRRTIQDFAPGAGFALGRDTLENLAGPEVHLHDARWVRDGRIAGIRAELAFGERWSLESAEAVVSATGAAGRASVEDPVAAALVDALVRARTEGVVARAEGIVRPEAPWIRGATVHDSERTWIVVRVTAGGASSHSAD
jgi:hypothetical protein